MRLVKNVAVAASLLVGVIASAQTYTIVDLSPGTSFDETLAYSLNGFGQATGTGYIASTGELRALMFKNGQVIDLGMFGYPYGADGDQINNAGQIAGTGYGPGYHAVRWTNGQITHLGSIDGGYSTPFSMNNSGDIVGRAINGDGGGQGFSYIGGHFSALPVDRASCINDFDQYVGSVGYYWGLGEYLYSAEHGYIYSNGVLTELGDLGGGVRTNTEAYGINNSAQVVGYSTTTSGYYHAFLYHAGGMQDLGSLDAPQSRAYWINNRGQIVGTLESTVGGVYGFFLYSSGQMKHFESMLDTTSLLTWSDLVLTGINDNGWISGYGTINGTTHAFIAMPAMPTPVIGPTPLPINPIH